MNFRFILVILLFPLITHPILASDNESKCSEYLSKSPENENGFARTSVHTSEALAKLIYNERFIKYTPMDFNGKMLKKRFLKIDSKKIDHIKQMYSKIKVKDLWTIYGAFAGIVVTHLSTALITNSHLFGEEYSIYQAVSGISEHLFSHIVVDELDDEFIVAAISGLIGRMYANKLLKLDIAKSVLKNSKVAPFAIGLTDDFLFSSYEFEKIFKLPSIQHELKKNKRNLRDLFQKDLVRFFYKLKADAIISEESVSNDLFLIIDGEKKFFEVEMTPIYSNSNDLMAVAGYIHNLDRVKEVEYSWFEKSQHDVMLNKLYNRSFMEMIIEQNIEIYRQEGKEFSILFLDIDKFKEVNDTYGHEAGDDVLYQMQNVLNDFFRGKDHIGRWGGEELIVLLEESNLEDSVVVAERLKNQIEKTKFMIKLENNELKEIDITVTIGVSSFNRLDDLKSVVGRADQGLYKGKSNGRNQVVSVPFEE